MARRDAWAWAALGDRGPSQAGRAAGDQGPDLARKARRGAEGWLKHEAGRSYRCTFGPGLMDRPEARKKSIAQTRHDSKQFSAGPARPVISGRVWPEVTAHGRARALPV
jgi:hypothetical protein